ncbi:hypothetical protein [Parashewanella tropica]|uniref:hypothetical protein n=1 Tax=Parashewanella tropica TaxID=2547970 RepID=UPI001059235A|nr:hypothetical protein [Parashewanella tropica]
MAAIRSVVVSLVQYAKELTSKTLEDKVTELIQSLTENGQLNRNLAHIALLAGAEWDDNLQSLIDIQKSDPALCYLFVKTLKQQKKLNSQSLAFAIQSSLIINSNERRAVETQELLRNIWGINPSKVSLKERFFSALPDPRLETQPLTFEQFIIVSEDIGISVSDMTWLFTQCGCGADIPQIKEYKGCEFAGLVIMRRIWEKQQPRGLTLAFLAEKCVELRLGTAALKAKDWFASRERTTKIPIIRAEQVIEKTELGCFKYKDERGATQRIFFDEFLSDYAEKIAENLGASESLVQLMALESNNDQKKMWSNLVGRYFRGNFDPESKLPVTQEKTWTNFLEVVERSVPVEVQHKPDFKMWKQELQKRI